LGEVSQQAGHVVGASLQFVVVTLGDVVDANVGFATGRKMNSDFLAEEKVRVMAERFGRIDRVMISNGDESHAALFQPGIELLGRGVAFATEMLKNRHGTHSGVPRMDMHVAAHGLFMAGEDYKTVTNRRNIRESFCF
jgi:hypothetical protein